MKQNNRLFWFGVTIVLGMLMYSGCTGSQSVSHNEGGTRLYHATIDTVIAEARDAAGDADFDVQNGVWNNDHTFTFTMVKRNLADNSDGSVQSFQFNVVVEKKDDNTVSVTYDEGPHGLGYSITVDPSIGYRRLYLSALDNRMEKIPGAIQ